MRCTKHPLCFSQSRSHTHINTRSMCMHTQSRGQQSDGGDYTGRCGPGFTPQDAKIRLVSEHHLSENLSHPFCKKPTFYLLA